MFQTFMRRAFTCNTNHVVPLKLARFNSTLQARQRPKEVVDVKLIGTLYQEPLTLKNGFKIITVRTFQPDGHYKVHRAVISNPKILNLVGDSLSIGQRVCISGKLDASPFKNNSDQVRQSFLIRVNELYASRIKETNPNANTVDLNSIFFLGHIATDIIHYENASSFSVCTHYTTRNQVEGETEKTQFIRVYVHDNNLVQLVKKNLQKRDRVFLNGFLGMKPETDENGQKKFGGHIEATNILKVDRFNEYADENPIEESVKSGNE